ncbi:MAG: competence/damage-inducible protein A [Rhodospirillum sp.]|nr:competence/damage-inducible protein A [Rhodospirillum sp.]MCF8489537.1 competence/damage-inducible protein A [Rhodospirillum sp.]MCF8502044.1 competence/damage-inducible protein A [Rhodospirillum sp.]
MTTTSATPTAALVIIGNEILSGRTHDVNGQWLGARLAGMGIPLKEIRVVADDKGAIVEAVNALRARNTYVFTTGGIGPTHDDITTECVAAAFGAPVVLDPEARRRLEAHYGERHQDLNEARLRMAHVPEGSVLIANPVSAAPGFRLDNVHVLAGVPPIMRAMFDGIAHTLTGGPPIRSLAVTSHVREGDIAESLGALQDGFKDTDIGSYPFAKGNRIGTSVVIRGTDPQLLKEVGAQVAALMRGLGEDPDLGEVV